MTDLPKHKQFILFDGICNLCNSTVQYVINRDKKDIFMFIPLQSKKGKEIVNTLNVDTQKTDSIILYTKQGVYYKSSAALKIAYRLDFPTCLWSVFLIIPAFIRNGVYDYIAGNRYKWYGKKETCMVPTPELKSKFLA